MSFTSYISYIVLKKLSYNSNHIVFEIIQSSIHPHKIILWSLFSKAKKSQVLLQLTNNFSILYANQCTGKRHPTCNGWLRNCGCFSTCTPPNLIKYTPTPTHYHCNIKIKPKCYNALIGGFSLLFLYSFGCFVFFST